MKIEKFLNKKTSKKTKISILEKMLKECEAGGGTLPVKKAKQIITAYVPEKTNRKDKHENKRNKTRLRVFLLRHVQS